MFVVQGVFETLHSPDIVRQQDLVYDRLLHDAPGIRINQYLRGLEDTNSQLHLMVWDNQDDSEAFGVSDAFQTLRVSAPPSTQGPRSKMAHVLSPGYWTLEVNSIPAPLPVGKDGHLGRAIHLMVTTKAGQEQAFEGFVRAGDGLAGLPGYAGHRLLRNLGNPHEFALYVYLADDAPPSTIEGIHQAIAPYVSHTSGGLYQVELSSVFPA